jgi:transposase
MNSATTARVLSLEEAAEFAPEQVVGLSRELAAARHQLEWYKRQLFGHKSERRLIESDSARR